MIALGKEIVRAVCKLLNNVEFNPSEREESLKVFKSGKGITSIDVGE